MTRYTEVDGNGIAWLIHATVKPGTTLCHACQGWIDRDDPKDFTVLTVPVDEGHRAYDGHPVPVDEGQRAYALHPDCAEEVQVLIDEGREWYAALRTINRSWRWQ